MFYKYLLNNSKPLFPEGFKKEDSLFIIINKLLKKKVNERLCSLEVIKKEKFYEGINFVKKIKKNYQKKYYQKKLNFFNNLLFFILE